MASRWIKNFTPQPIVLEMAKHADVTGKGVTLKNLIPDTYIDMLTSSFEFKPNTPRSRRVHIMRSAVYTLLGRGGSSARELSTEVSRAENSLLRSKPKPYVLITSLSISGKNIITRVLEGTRISIGKPVPKNFDRIRQLRRAERFLPFDLPKQYSPVLVSVNCSGPEEACEVALNSVDLLRGIWNYSLTFGKAKRNLGNFPEPANEIVIGPLHTLHDATGLPVSDTFYYEPFYRKPNKIFNIGRHYEDLRNEELLIRRRIRTSKIGDVLTNAFIRYARILDEPIAQHAFVGLWGLLEVLTSTKNAEYKEMVKRLAFLWHEHDKDIVLQEVEYLRRHRNSLVHGASDVSSGQSDLYLLKTYVDVTMGFLLNRENSMYTMEELGEYMSQPIEMSEIDRRLQILSRAKRFRS